MKYSNRSSNLLLTLFFTFLAQAAWAGTATIAGFGEAAAPAEFITVKVIVSSQCYSSALAASAANDEIANRVLQSLKTRANLNNKDEVTATGGFVERYSGYNPANGQAICIEQFKKQNQLTLKTHSVDSFSQVFAVLQDELYAMGMEMPRNAIDKPTSFIEMSEPAPGLSSETLVSLEKIALVEALKNAREKFQVTLALAGITTYKIAGYSDVGPTLRPQPEFEKSRAAADNAAPVQFSQLKVTKMLNVQFQFEGGDLTVPAFN